jgi:hypothetical protein
MRLVRLLRRARLVRAGPQLVRAGPQLMGTAPQLMGTVPQLMGTAPQLVRAARLVPEAQTPKPMCPVEPLRQAGWGCPAVRAGWAEARRGGRPTA